MRSSGSINQQPVALVWNWARCYPLQLAFALLYATALTNLPLEAFQDRQNYLIYAGHSDQIMANFMATGLTALLANEPLWLLLNMGLAEFFAPNDVLRILIFTPAFLVSFLLLLHNPRHVIWLIFLLLLPQVLKNHIIHLRQGTALAVFLLGYCSKQKWRGRLLMLAAGLIHSSFLFIACIFGITTATSLLPLSPRQRLVLQLLCFIVLGAATMAIASNLGARQGAEYAGIQAEWSGLGFLFWAIGLLVFLSAERKFLQKNIAPLSILLFYIATYFVLPVSARIFESGLVLVCVLGLELSGWRRYIFLVQLFGYGVIQYSMRLGSEWLGWGINY